MTGGARLSDEQRLDWLRLFRSESVGPKTFKSLINRFGGAAAAVDALPELARQRGRALRVATREDCERELAGLAALGGRMVATGDADYPAALNAIDAPPPLISVLGNVPGASRPCVAIVGSRNASAAGIAFCERIARDLGDAGFAIVSGLARGIDTRAHRSSLGTGTIAVLAGGLDRVYPAENVPLAREIVERGALVTEMPLGFEPRGRDFPRRNRLVSGLSLGVVVIEAARRSGSLITARFATEQGREVFAVPGSPLDPRAEGAIALLREGATLCASAEDVITALTPLIETGPRPTRLAEDAPEATTEPLWDEFEPEHAEQTPRTMPAHQMDEPDRSFVSSAPSAPRRGGAEAVATLESLLGPVPASPDDIARAAGLTIGDTRAALLDLELSGRLERHGGGLVSLLPAAASGR